MIAWVVTYAWHNRSDRLFQTLLIAQTANRSLRCGGGRARNPSRPGGQRVLHLTGRIYACSRNACELSHDIALAIPGGSIYAITLRAHPVGARRPIRPAREELSRGGDANMDRDRNTIIEI